MSSPIQATGLAEAKSLLSLPYAGEDYGLADCPVILVELTAAALSQWPSPETADLVNSTPAVMVASVPDDRDPADAPKLAEICDPFDIVLASGDLPVALAVPADEIDPDRRRRDGIAVCGSGPGSAPAPQRGPLHRRRAGGRVAGLFHSPIRPAIPRVAGFPAHPSGFRQL